MFDFIINRYQKDRKIMALFDRVEAIEAKDATYEARLTQAETDIAALKAAPGVDNTAAIAAVDAKVDALRADVGFPTAP